MRRTTQNTNIGIRWRLTSSLEDLDFADDIALLSSTHAQMQRKTDKMTEIAKKVGLKINEKKTKMLRMNNKKKEAVKIERNDIEDVDEFTYLGAKVSKDGGAGSDMKSRINKARNAFSKLNKVWKSKQFCRKTKVKLYKTLVRPVLLFGCETWRMTQLEERRLDSFQFKCLKRILGIYWPNVISIEELNNRTKVQKISHEVKRRRWSWLGHVLRKKNEHHCMIALTWKPDGRRKVGRPKTTWRRTVEQERNREGWKTWSEVRGKAKDRKGWKQSVEALCARTGHEENRWIDSTILHARNSLAE
jgi:hypothetical protein